MGRFSNRLAAFQQSRGPRTGHGAGQGTREIPLWGKPSPRRLRTPRSLRRLISQGEQYIYQRCPVANAVVNTPKKDAAALIAFDESERPQRPIQVQGLDEQSSNGFVESLLIPRRGQRDAPNVRAQIEFWIDLPIGSGSEGPSILHHALTKPLVDQKALLKHSQHMLILQQLLKDPEAVDHHRIGRIVHLQPSSIYAGHRFASGHRNALHDSN